MPNIRRKHAHLERCTFLLSCAAESDDGHTIDVSTAFSANQMRIFRTNRTTSSRRSMAATRPLRTFHGRALTGSRIHGASVYKWYGSSGKRGRCHELGAKYSAL